MDILDRIDNYLNEGNIEIDELVNFITDDKDLYEKRVVPILKNLKKKLDKGSYDHTLAIKAWKPLADDGAKLYGKRFGSGEREGFVMFTASDRNAVAKELQNYYDEELRYNG